MNKLNKKTVYLPVTKGHTTKTVICDSGENIPVKQEDLFVFTPEQFNQLLSDVIKDALNTAAEKAKLIKPDRFGTCESSIAYTEEGEVYISHKSITNTFDETFNKFKV